MPSVLITGSNRGIGLELAKQYAKQQWRVFATTRVIETADALKGLSHQHDNLSIHVLDTANEQHRRHLFKHLEKEPIDVLINNAGIWGQFDARFHNTDEEQWLRGFQVNTIAPMMMMQTFIGNILAGQLKVIANITSKMGSLDDNTSGGSYVYRSSKTALNMVTKSASIDLADREIKVVAIHPGWVRTNMGGPHGEINVLQSAEQIRHILESLTLNDSGKFFDIDGSEIPW